MAAYPSKTETTVGLLFRKSVESVIEWTLHLNKANTQAALSSRARGTFPNAQCH